MLKLVSGNWKMNGSKKDLDQWFEDFFKMSPEFKNVPAENLPTTLICLPSIFIEYAQELAKKYNEKSKTIRVNIGCQDVHSEERGAYTGNNSVLFAKEFGVKYTLVGHSERRQYEGETDSFVAKKAVIAISNGITPIICVGEPKEVREKGRHIKFVEDGILGSTEGVDVKKAVIAYEPVWGIGAGLTPTFGEIEEINFHIKKVLAKKNSIKESEVIVLYGASVKSSNVKEIAAQKSVDGVLVGGASLKGEEFFNIIKNSLSNNSSKNF
ncbi:MAG: triose-phosphate isomerase [Rickettsiales bacterium]|jgi:triosephosphate isomerase|nr:triose-phosphate isomerase [Rickettsiales bacterium]